MFFVCVSFLAACSGQVQLAGFYAWRFFLCRCEFESKTRGAYQR
ncbi:hypothetical protein ALQ72_100933 [Pseudomonas syringae pv. maculicola]|uniref:Uncharacterized protein n=1 Tax=Pseudomonas syringae pv. maculicola TaxID=59511 RepID=A0A3M6B503_PSEYM|nr:hypothetical protein ALQ72_100933 [Pseudomonas syringae pv. maculicola]RMV26452.1 hypothetical protein ALP13_103908 [Pseudomonas syringae pv. maculicola]